MKWVIRFFLGVAIILLLAAVVLYATGNSHVLNGIGKTYLEGKTSPDIDDMPYFHLRKVTIADPQPWPVSGDMNAFVLAPQAKSAMDTLETTAFLVFHRDTLIWEQYAMGYSDTTHSNSFSMAKSFTAIAIGIAIDEGYIQSLDQKVGDFIPEFAEGRNAALTIRHLLQMASGIPFGESYNNPLGYMARAYYGTDLLEETMKFRVEKDPGSLWVYEGGNTVLLGMILQRATGKTVSQYFAEKVWSCVGAEAPAYWNLDDKDGMEKTYSGFYATARDFARIGKLYAHNGVWDGDTLVNPEFVQACITPSEIPDSTGENCYWYGLHWWMGEYDGHPLFSCRGLRGQYIIVVPSLELMVVRLGHLQSPERVRHMPLDIDLYLGAAVDMIRQRQPASN
jgi:CubicO group peptidase (beta-lactamase class C family)